ncbi:hypothetical protein BT69DRAFT_1339989 [Atractiella rhizophila]|nr:hypothetical protein BT69DRAFT_1339989 [Atractiella rhizophila]
MPFAEVEFNKVKSSTVSINGGKAVKVKEFLRSTGWGAGDSFHVAGGRVFEWKAGTWSGKERLYILSPRQEIGRVRKKHRRYQLDLSDNVQLTTEELASIILAFGLWMRRRNRDDVIQGVVSDVTGAIVGG